MVVKFDENNIDSFTPRIVEKHSFLTEILLSLGLIEDPKQANVAFVAFLVVFVGLAIFVFWSNSTVSTPTFDPGPNFHDPNG